jgi:hypothetical protein
MLINLTGFRFLSAAGLPGLPPLWAPPNEQDPPPPIAPVAPESLASYRAAFNARMPGYVVVGKFSGLTPTAVFALATPKSPIDRGGRWQLQFYFNCNFFCAALVGFAR